MQRLYWRPQKVSLRVLALIALCAALGMLAVERYRIKTRGRFYGEKVAAAQLAKRMFDKLRDERLQRGIPIDTAIDPGKTGILGELMSPITTNPGHLQAKRASINPNFAAVVVDMLARAKVKKGDAVAVGMSGSFPALNVNVLAAMQALEIRALVISSMGASQFGANHPQLTWADMERVLRDAGLTTTRSLEMSRGGIDDRGVGLSARSLALMDEAAQRNDVRLFVAQDYAKSLEHRMALYRDAAKGTPIRAYINVGGGTVSVGTRVGKHLFRPGLNKLAPDKMVDSVMARFASDGIPVIHLSGIKRIVERFGLDPMPDQIPAVGRSTVYERLVYNRGLAAGILVVLFLALVAFIRLDWGYRLLAQQRSESNNQRPEPMV